MNFNFARDTCFKCAITEICSVYASMEVDPPLAAAMTGCRYFVEATNNRNVGIGNNTIAGTKKGAFDRSDIIRKLQELGKAQEEELKHKNVPTGANLVCSECGSEDEELVLCDKCGKPVCGYCVTETLNGKSLCPKCYGEDESSDIIPFTTEKGLQDVPF